MRNKLCKIKLDSSFLSTLVDLAEIAVDGDGDTIDFILTEKDGIRMGVSISFSFTNINKEDK